MTRSISVIAMISLGRNELRLNLAQPGAHHTQSVFHSNSNSSALGFGGPPRRNPSRPIGLPVPRQRQRVRRHILGDA
jgi:hypothetical protein